MLLIEAGAFRDVDAAIMAHPGPENAAIATALAIHTYAKLEKILKFCLGFIM